MNTMLSLFTPSTAFTMDNDEFYNKYVNWINGEGPPLTESIENVVHGCWQWMTGSDALAKASRPKSMIRLLTKEVAEKIDDILVDMLSGHEKTMMVQTSGWMVTYDEYTRKVKDVLKKTYATVITDEEDAQLVHQGIMRRMAWITMRHPKRTIPPYPLLTKSLLPKVADQLTSVKGSIKEVRCNPHYSTMMPGFCVLCCSMMSAA